MRLFLPIVLSAGLAIAVNPGGTAENPKSGNPLFPGWYADPEAVVFGDEYWIFPTYSDEFRKQLHLDAFSSRDLVQWRKHDRILDTTIIGWARLALWAPSAVEKDGRYYLFFSANDVQHPASRYWDPAKFDTHFGGIGVAVADAPGGPYRDLLGQPLISTFHHEAQPIDPFVYRDDDGTFLLFYGGWGRCNVGRLNADFTGFEPWDDGQLFREITPEGYVEGPFVFRRDGKYYFMWSEGNWTDGSYQVAYGMSDQVTGPYQRIGVVLSSDPAIATGAGHHSAIRVPGTDEWFMVYHRRPIPNLSPHHRVTCIDRMEFNEDGTIKPVQMTFDGVPARPIER
jgi:beta-xylosidase